MRQYHHVVMPQILSSDLISGILLFKVAMFTLFSPTFSGAAFIQEVVTSTPKSRLKYNAYNNKSSRTWFHQLPQQELEMSDFLCNA